MAAAALERLRHDLLGLLHRGQEVREFSLDAARIVRRAVPFDGICVLTMDPATCLPTGEVVENGLPGTATARMTEIEIGEPDFNKFDVLARARSHAASLSEATGGDLDRSRRHRELKRPNGFGDELRAALVDEAAVWGGITLLREAGRRDFAPADAQLLAAAAPYLAAGLRRAIVLGALSSGAESASEPAGLVLLADDNTIELANPAAERWLAELGRSGELLPAVVTAVAGRARGAGGEATLARARVRTASGAWLLVHGSLLGDGPGARAAVILEPARSPELAPLIADAYGLTERERAVTQLVAHGLSTTAIGGRLYLSSWTVQDHLKAIFEKVGVSSRGELIARVFFEHYAPRLSGGAAPGSDGWFMR